MLKIYRPILGVDFFKQLLEESEDYKNEEIKQKEQELEVFAEIIANKVAEKLKGERNE